MLLECAVLPETMHEYYTADSLKTLFEMIPDTYIVEFLWEAGLFHLIWTVKYYMQFLIWISSQFMEFLT